MIKHDEAQILVKFFFFLNSVDRVQSHLNFSKRTLGSSGCSIRPVLTQGTGGGDLFWCRQLDLTYRVLAGHE